MVAWLIGREPAFTGNSETVFGCNRPTCLIRGLSRSPAWDDDEGRLSNRRGPNTLRDRAHHIGSFNPGDAMLTRTYCDIEEKHEPDRRQLQRGPCD